jgi:hypothetical protein
MTKDEALAMDLALEALEFFKGLALSIEEIERAEEAITAIKQARALDKKAENARELGLDYEPAEWLTGCPECGMDSGCDCDSGTRNPPAAPVQEDWGPGPHECHSLTASVQEPVAWRYRGILHDFDPSDWAEGPVTPLYTTPPAQPAPVQEPVIDHSCKDTYELIMKWADIYAAQTGELYSQAAQDPSKVARMADERTMLACVVAQAISQPHEPDLLSALKRILDEPNNTMSDGKALKEIIRIARRAITKATGEKT